MTAAPGQRWKIGPAAAATASEERRMGVLSSPLLNSATMVSPVLDWIMYLQGAPAPDRICTSRAMTLLASMRMVLTYEYSWPWVPESI